MSNILSDATKFSVLDSSTYTHKLILKTDYKICFFVGQLLNNGTISQEL